jgi:hypothetical protein
MVQVRKVQRETRATRGTKNRAMRSATVWIGGLEL